MTSQHLTTGSTVVMRAARGSDGPALERLASLDSKRLARGDMLVAEVDGRIDAAIALDGGVIANPFRPTADVVALLELHAERARGERNGRRPLAERLGLRPLPRARAA
jgi:hypothetical protein